MHAEYFPELCVGSLLSDSVCPVYFMNDQQLGESELEKG